MIRLIFIIPILLSCVTSNKEFSSIKTTDTNGFSIPISWFNELKGDFSFTNNWEYADGIELNDYQQIICWKCPPRAQKILDKRRKVPTDSLAVFYSLIDSTRHYFSLDSRSTLTNMNNNHFITVKRYGDFTVEGFTKSRDSLNCSLFFRIKDDFINSWVYVKNGNDTKIYTLKEGKFFTDKKVYENGFLKANFSFVYESENSFKAIFWSGKMYAKISGI